MRPDKTNFWQWMDRRRPLKYLTVRMVAGADGERNIVLFTLSAGSRYLLNYSLKMPLGRKNWRSELAQLIWMTRADIRRRSPIRKPLH